MIFFVTLLFVSCSPAPSRNHNRRQTPVVEVVQDWAPSVVNISTERIVLLRQIPFWQDYGNIFDNFFQQYSNRNAVSAFKTKSIGSGVVIGRGMIMTNAHVVNMANKIFVTFSNGKTAEGHVVLVSQEVDLALIEIQPPFALKAVRLADPDDVMIGETVVAIGDPFGLENSVTVGVVSGKNRSFPLPNSNRVFKNLIQTDASINPGSSGGALLNLDGELVGINLAVVLNAQNIGFAISSKTIRTTLDQYKDATRSERDNKTTHRILVN